MENIHTKLSSAGAVIYVGSIQSERDKRSTVDVRINGFRASDRKIYLDDHGQSVGRKFSSRSVLEGTIG